VSPFGGKGAQVKRPRLARLRLGAAARAVRPAAQRGPRPARTETAFAWRHGLGALGRPGSRDQDLTIFYREPSSPTGHETPVPPRPQ